MTRARREVVEVLRHHPHATVDDVGRHLREGDGTDAVSVQALYDVLAALQRVGLVRRFQPAGSPARFELDHRDNHHHVVCRSCGDVSDVACATGEAPCLHTGPVAAVAPGFTVDEAEVTFWGLCAGCAHS